MSSFSHFFSRKFQHICISLNVNVNESLTNDVISFEQLAPVLDQFRSCLKVKSKLVKMNDLDEPLNLKQI